MLGQERSGLGSCSVWTLSPWILWKCDHRCRPQAPAPEELHLGLVAALCSCAARALRAPGAAPLPAAEGGGDASCAMALEAIAQLGQQSGLLSWAKLVHSERAEFVLRQAHRLVAALAGAPARGLGGTPCCTAAACCAQCGSSPAPLLALLCRQKQPAQNIVLTTQPLPLAARRLICPHMPPLHAGRANSPEGREALGGVVGLVDEVMAQCEASEAKYVDKTTAWSMRAEMGRVRGYSAGVCMGGCGDFLRLARCGGCWRWPAFYLVCFRCARPPAQPTEVSVAVVAGAQDVAACGAGCRGGKLMHDISMPRSIATTHAARGRGVPSQLLTTRLEGSFTAQARLTAALSGNAS